jgi:hypothetical protein
MLMTPSNFAPHKSAAANISNTAAPELHWQAVPWSNQRDFSENFFEKVSFLALGNRRSAARSISPKTTAQGQSFKAGE